MTRDINWVKEQVKLCQSIYSNFMWGKDFERLQTEAQELEISFVALVNFSDTRFANSKSVSNVDAITLEIKT